MLVIKYILSLLIIYQLHTIAFANNVISKISNNISELIEQSKVEFANGNYEAGRLVLNSIEKSYISNTISEEMELIICDSYFFDTNNNSQLQAITLYEDYLKKFPETIHKGYILHNIASYFYSTQNTIGCDQTPTYKAINLFQKIIEEVPNSIYSIDAKEKINVCKKHLATTKLKIGIFYFKQQNYRQAENRLKEIILSNDYFTDYEKTYYYLAESIYNNIKKRQEKKPTQKTNLNKQIEAIYYYNKLINEYPNSTLSIKAYDRLNMINKN